MKTFPLDVLNANAAAATPVAMLCSFLMGAQRWDYTNAKESIDYNGRTYTPAPLTRDPIQLAVAPDDRPMTLRCGHLLPFSMFNGHDLPGEIKVQIRRIWTDAPTFADLIFAGTVSNVNDSDAGLEIECRGPLSSLNQQFPAINVGPACTLEHYSSQCGLNRLLFRVQGVIHTIYRNEIGVPAFNTKPDGWFARGYAESNGVLIGIESHVGVNIRTTVPPTSWKIGDTIVAYAGCDHLPATCQTKFNNMVNFLGLGVGMPNRNPVLQKVQ